MKKLRCLVVDDEELARSLLETHILKLDFLELIGMAEGPVEAMGFLRENQVDLLFLDIQMPEIKGTDFAKMLPMETRVIFTTAYSEYALEGFELNALDYLLKPITFERFLKAVSRLKDALDNEPADTITVKSGYDLHKLKYDDILYIKSDSEYVVYYTASGNIMSVQSLTALEKKLPKAIFIRVHRSYIVNKTKVNTLKSKDLLLGEIVIPVSDSYFELVKKALF